MRSVVFLRCVLRRLGNSIASNPSFHSSPVNTVGSFWRERNGLPKYGNEYGPLTDLPDWSYADGRPAPLGKGQRERKVKNANLTKKIIQLMGEVDFAVERERRIKDEEKYERQKILKEKLKPKGDQLVGS